MKLEEAFIILLENGYKISKNNKLNEKFIGTNEEPTQYKQIVKYTEKLGYVFDQHQNTSRFVVYRKGDYPWGKINGVGICGEFDHLTGYLLKVIYSDNKVKYFYGRTLKDWKEDLKTIGL